MADPIKPQKRASFGMDSWGYAPLVADIEVPKLTELEAVTGLNISCFLFNDQEGLTATTEKSSLPLLLCETEGYEDMGATTYSMSDLSSAFDPQAPAGSDGKKSWETLGDYIAGYLWRRQGVRSTEPLAVGQFVDVVPVRLGKKVPGKTAMDASGAYRFTQPVAITGSPAFNVPVVAGT